MVELIFQSEACDYDANTGDVIVSGVDRIGGNHEILSVDPKTHHNKLIASIDDIEDVRCLRDTIITLYLL